MELEDLTGRDQQAGGGAEEARG